MIVTSRRACAAGAWAAVMLALAVTGPQWAFTPWFAVPALTLLAGLGLYALGLFDPHHARKDGPPRGIRTTRRERKERISDSEAASQEAWDAMLAGYRPLAIEPAPAHSATWGEPRTDVLGDLPAFTPHLTAAEDFKADFLAAVEHGTGPPLLVSPPHVSGWIPEEHDRGCPCVPCAERRQPAVVVTGGTAGRHARDREYAFQSGPDPYCGNCGQAGHWRGDPQCTGDVVVDDLIARRRDGTVALAIAGYVAEAGFRSHGGDTDAMLDSIIGGIEPVQP